MNKLTCVCVIAFVTCAIWGDTVKFRVLVLDSQTDLPVPGAVINAGFEEDRGVWARDRYKCTFKQYVSDNNGCAQVQGSSNNGEAGATIVSAEGYYTPAHSDVPRFHKKNFFGVWQPDDIVVTVKLQRVERPIPLWVKRSVLDVDKDISNVNKGKFAYDLMMGEWLPPFGKGRVADIEFARLPHEDLGEVDNDGIKGTSFKDSMSVTFPGTGNGLLEMRHNPMQVLRIRTAPESGYRPNYLRWEGRNEKLQWDSNYKRDKSFCFRIRTRRDEKGNIIEAYYGKVYGDFEMFKGYNYIVCGARFHYYLNPISLDRNLEWDMKNNLCPGSLVSPRP